MMFERMVFWSGIWNVGLGLILITPPIREFLGLQVPNPFWPCIVAVFLCIRQRRSFRARRTCKFLPR